MGKINKYQIKNIKKINSCQGFHVLRGVDNVLEYLFHEILEKDEFWTDPGAGCSKPV